jgi:hypothetical protein
MQVCLRAWGSDILGYTFILRYRTIAYKNQMHHSYIICSSILEFFKSRAVRAAAVTAAGAYNFLAAVSGGTVYTTDKAHIGAVVDVIKVSCNVIIISW